MGIFLTPLVKSEINWFYSCKARQRCISSFDSGWQPVKVLWIFHCLKNEAPPTPPLTVPSRLLPFRLLLSPSPLCASHDFVSSYLFLLLIQTLLLFCHYILLHNGFLLTLTSASSSMSALMCLNASQALVSVTQQTHCHRGYREELSQRDCQFQGAWCVCGGVVTQTGNHFVIIDNNVFYRFGVFGIRGNMGISVGLQHENYPHKWWN